MDTPDVVFKILKQLIFIDKKSFLSLKEIRLVSKLWKSECDFVINNYLTKPKKIALSLFILPITREEKNYEKYLTTAGGFRFAIPSIGCSVELMKCPLKNGKENTYYVKLESVYGPKTFILLEKCYLISPWNCNTLKIFTKSSPTDPLRYIFVCALSNFKHIIDFTNFPTISHALCYQLNNTLSDLNCDGIKATNLEDIMFFNNGYFVKELQTYTFLIRSFNLRNGFVGEIRLSDNPDIKHFGVSISTVVIIEDDSDELWFVDVPTFSLVFKYSIKPSNVDQSSGRNQNYIKLVTPGLKLSFLLKS